MYLYKVTQIVNILHISQIQKTSKSNKVVSWGMCPILMSLSVLGSELNLWQLGHLSFKVKRQRSVTYMSTVQYNRTLWPERLTEQSLFRDHSGHSITALSLFGHKTMQWSATVIHRLAFYLEVGLMLHCFRKKYERDVSYTFLFSINTILLNKRGIVLIEV